MILVSYWIIVSLLFVFFVMFLLANNNVIFKKNRIGFFLRSHGFKYCMKRLLLSILSLLIIMISLFFLMRFTIYNNYQYTEDLVNEFNKPIISKENIFHDFLNYCYNLLPFPKKVCSATKMCDNQIVCSKYEYKIINLGYSYSYMKNVSVIQIIKEKASVSFLIGSIAYVLECLIGYPLGIYLAKKKNKVLNKSLDIVHVTSLSVPRILQFYLFLIIFMVYFKLPVSFEINNILSYIAPILSVVIFGCLSVAYWVRKYFLLEMNKDYVKYAKSKGLSDNYIFYHHIFKNALSPLIRTIPTSLFACLCGYYLLELTFNIPGIGYTLMTAIKLNDVHLIEGLILFFSSFSVLSYFIGDIIAILLDKRIYLKKEVKHNEK